jgi:hypothetical protein
LEDLTEDRRKKMDLIDREISNNSVDWIHLAEIGTTQAVAGSGRGISEKQFNSAVICTGI